MLDTIHIELRNLRNYPELQNHLRQYDVGVKDTVSFSKNLHQRFIHYANPDGVNIVTSYSHKLVASHHYEVAYRIDYVRDIISFNISIPKFLYGNNIRQFVAHKLDKDFDYYKAEDVEYNLQETFSRLQTFVKMFNNKFLRANLSDIVLKRIDFCFNRFFQNKVDKAQYLFYLKGKSIRYTRDSSNSPIYRTGIYRSSRYMTCKIYDKGEEFKKHDAKKIIHRLDKLQLVADKILRYEIEFKASIWKRYIRQELEKQTSSSYCRYLQKNFTTNVLSVRDWKNFDLNFDNKSQYFFNKKIFMMCARKFYKFVQHHSVNSVPVDALTEKIIGYNNYCKNAPIIEKKVSDRNLKKFVKDLNEYGRDKIFRLNLYSRSTYYRNITLLKKIGFENVEILSPCSFVNNFNFGTYHTIFH